LRRASKVPFAGQGDEHFQLVDHSRNLPCATLARKAATTYL
jgi:hypothetical protein